MTQKTSNCPACFDRGYTRSHVIRNYTYYSCRNCGMLYLPDVERTAGLADEQYDADYFKDTLKENMSGYMDYAKQARPLCMNFRILLSRISHHMTFDKQKTLLDVGCAYGFFLDEARKLGMSVHGLDVSRSAIQWMEKHLGIEGTAGVVSDAPKGPFDLITAIEVIEHSPDPRSFIDGLSERLKEGGILAIVTGANDTPVARLLGRRWWYLNPPDHCSIFSRPAMKKLITEKGYHILEHGLVPFHWVGMNNMILKLARVLEVERLGRVASRLPTIVLPVFHYTAQILIAKKQ